MLDYTAGQVGESGRSAREALATALTGLAGALQPIAFGNTACGAAARGLLGVVKRHHPDSSPQQFIEMYQAAYRVRDAARRRSAGGYDWRAWAEVSRFAKECLVAAVRTMREEGTPPPRSVGTSTQSSSGSGA